MVHINLGNQVTFSSVFRVVCPQKIRYLCRPGFAAELCVLGRSLRDVPDGSQGGWRSHVFSCSFYCHWGLEGVWTNQSIITRTYIQGGSLNLRRFCQLFCGSSAFVHLGFQVCHFHNSYLLITSLSNWQKGVEKFATMLTKFMQRLWPKLLSLMSSLKDSTVIGACYIFVASLVCLVNVREHILVKDPTLRVWTSQNMCRSCV